MSNEPNPDDLKVLWQNQEVEKMTITIDEIRRRSTCFERRIHWRNIREYVAGAIAIAFLLPQFQRGLGWHLLPAVLLIAGTLFALLQMHLRGGARQLPADAGLKASLEFHRVELERQRDAVRSVWLWYLMPFVPGLVATLVWAAMQHGIGLPVILGGAAFILLFGAVWMLNQRAARLLDRKIAELDSNTNRSL